MTGITAEIFFEFCRISQIFPLIQYRIFNIYNPSLIQTVLRGRTKSAETPLIDEKYNNSANNFSLLKTSHAFLYISAKTKSCYYLYFSKYSILIYFVIFRSPGILAFEIYLNEIFRFCLLYVNVIFIRMFVFQINKILCNKSL